MKMMMMKVFISSQDKKYISYVKYLSNKKVYISKLLQLKNTLT